MVWGSKKVGDKTVRYPRQPKLDRTPEYYECAVCHDSKMGFPFLLEGQPLCSKCQDELESKEFQDYERQRQSDKRIESQ